MKSIYEFKKGKFYSSFTSRIPGLSRELGKRVDGKVTYEDKIYAEELVIIPRFNIYSNHTYWGVGICITFLFFNLCLFYKKKNNE